MTGLVLVSHSQKLALAVRELVTQMTHSEVPIAVAAGVGDAHEELGTDAVHIADVLEATYVPGGLLVLMDLGSAVLSSQAALELLDKGRVSNIRLCSAPLVEGALAAAVQAQAGASLDEIYREAKSALIAKQQQLEDTEPGLRAESSSATGDAIEIVLRIENEHGLHARPAAMLVQTASRFSSEIRISNETTKRGPAAANSMTSLALLEVHQGDSIRVRATGADSKAALNAIAELVEKNFGETSPPSAPPRPSHTEAKSASPGIAIGPLLSIESAKRTSVPADLGTAPANRLGDEWDQLEGAMRRVRDQLEHSGEQNAILAAQSLILEDPVLLEKLRSLIRNAHRTAIAAWTEGIEDFIRAYQSLNDDYLRERTADLRDLSNRILEELTGGPRLVSISPSEPAILFAQELLPGDATLCDPQTVLGVISTEGSPTSHSAVILRTLGIPMVVGVDAAPWTGRTVAIDAGTGEVWFDPDQQSLEDLTSRRARAISSRQSAEATKYEPCRTIDGEEITLMANIGNPTEVATAASSGACGIGLLRTEFLFLNRMEAASEEEQEQALRDVFLAAPAGPVIVRALDAGADKPLQFLPAKRERNPFLGVRGIRLLLQYPECFRSHVRAILSAAAGKDIWLMVPMVSDQQEFERSRQLIEEAHHEMQSAGRPHLWPVKLGTMIEVPSAALLAGRLAAVADFFSIGTNDLTQYVMAAERDNASLAEFQDALNPAVLRLIKIVVEAADTKGKQVSVCGVAASDPIAAAVFFGLGIRHLSLRPLQIPELKAFFRRLHWSDLEHLATEALECVSASEVRALATARLST